MSHPTMQANASDAALETVVELNKNSDNKIDSALREATINGSIPTDIVNTGASSLCAKPVKDQPTKSECGNFKWKGPPFKTTGQKSTKVFQMALGNVARACDVVHLDLPLRKEATEAHTVQGLKHNLLSANRLTKSGYTMECNGDKVSFFNAHGNHRVTLRTAVLHGWYVPDEGLWQIPLWENNK